MTTGAIILAAGSGSRMGRTKQLMTIDEQSLVRRTVRAAIDAGLRPIVVVTGVDSRAVAAELQDLPITISFNPIWEKGIGSSIRCGISSILAAELAIDGAAILLCDQPRLDAAILRQLVRAFEASGRAMAACEYAGTAGPPCCFARSEFGGLSGIADGDGAKRLLLVNPEKLTKIAWPEGADDVDTPADWERLKKPRV